MVGVIMAKFSYRTVFISDVHLGSRHCRADYLLDFLAAVDCEQLYLVGDILDFWAMRRGVHWHTDHTAVISRIMDMAAKGTEVTYIPGNHDELLRPLAGRQFQGIQIRLNAEHATADGRRFYISHGDELDTVVRCNPVVKALGDLAYVGLMTLNRWIHWGRRRLQRPYWSFAAYVKRNMANAAEYVHRFEQAAAHATAKKGYDGYIGGHIHKANLTEIEGIVYCNDGDWVEHCTALVEDHQGTLQILHWTEAQSTTLSPFTETAAAA